MTKAEKEYGRWCAASIEDSALKEELENIKGNAQEINDRFYRELEFGTAGLRGIMGAGSNRMNIYTVRGASQALAQYLLESGVEKKIAIAYDSRNNSELFAKETARVFAANGIKVFIFDELAPTPILSYAVRELGCGSGVVITASHNPAAYNGYKAYGADGSQITPEVGKRVCDIMMGIDVFSEVKIADFESALEDGRIEYISEELKEKYLEAVKGISLSEGICKKYPVKTVYTSLCGTGIRYVPKMLRAIGAEDFFIVPEQEEPNGDFPTCEFPNPELNETLELGIKYCKESGAELLLATDPDCDRVSVAYKEGEDYRILTGNELGVLIADYICRIRSERGDMPKDAVAVRSIVSSPLADLVAEGYGVKSVGVYTGFRFIAEVIRELEAEGKEESFLFGFEESCGYLSGSFVRDKDGVQGCLLASETASYWKSRGLTLGDRLSEIYKKYGYRFDCQSNLYFDGESGMEKMKAIMKELRENAPEEVCGYKIGERTDYLSGKRVKDGAESSTGMPAANVLEYKFERGSVIVRPSGTEPKVKAYYSVSGTTLNDAESTAKEIKKYFEEKMA